MANDMANEVRADSKLNAKPALCQDLEICTLSASLLHAETKGMPLFASCT